VFEAIATLARWLPQAPREAAPLTAALTTLLAAEFPTLPISLALKQDGEWALYGAVTAATQTWVESLDCPELTASASQRRQPPHSARLAPSPDIAVVIAVWDKALPAAAFDALAAQIDLAFAGLEHVSTPTISGLDKHADALAAIQRIAHELNTTLNLDLVLQAVLREALAVTNATHGGIALQRPDSSPDAADFCYIVTSSAAPGATGALTVQPIGQGDTPADNALRSGRALIVDTPHDSMAATNGHTAAELDVPIRYQDHVVGLITLRSKTPGAFGPGELSFMRLVADQTAVAIGNAQSVAEQQRQRELLQQRANMLSEVLEVGHLLRADRSLPDMLTDVAYSIVNAVGFRAVLISLRGETAPDVFIPAAFAGMVPDDVERMREQPTPATIVEGLCNEKWRISSSYLLHGDDVREVYGEEMDELTTYVFFEERPSHEWQPDDMFVTPLRGPSGNIVGIIWIDDPFDRKRPTRRTAEAVEIFANQAAVAVENVRLYNDSQRRLAEQNALNRIHRAINASLETRHILREVYAELKPVLKMDSFYSFVYHHDSPSLGTEISSDGDTWREEDQHIKNQAGLHAYMMRTRQPLFFSDMRVEIERMPPDVRPVQFGNVTRRSASWIGTPLIAGDHEVIGSLSVHSYTPRRFGPHEFEFLQAVAHQVAISLQNARLFAERGRRLHEANIVNQLAQALAAPISLDELAEVFFSQISQALHVTSVLLAVYDRDNDVTDFPLVVDRNVRQIVQPQRSVRGVTEYMIRTCQPLLLNDDIPAKLAELEIVPRGDMCLSFVGVPLLVADQAVGIIAIQDYEQNHAFGQSDLELLQAIAFQIASGIEKARLLRERERQIAQMQTLNNIGKVTSSTLDLNELFIDMYIELSRYRKIDTLLLSVCEPQTYSIIQMMTIDRGQHHRVDQIQPIRPHSYTDVIMRAGKPLLLRNAIEEEPLYGIKPFMIGMGNRALSWAGVPLMNTSGQTFGMLSIQSYTAGEYDLRDIDFLTSVANQIALSIQNAALFRQSQAQIEQLAAETERLEMINRVSSWATAMPDIQELFQRTVNEMARMTNADQSRLIMYDRPRGIGICQAEYKDTGAVGRMTVRVANNLVAGWIDEHHAPLHAKNVTEDPRFVEVQELLSREHTQDMFLVPLIVKGEVIGTVSLATHQSDRSFSERDIATCETIANQVATAIENARLWNATQQSVRELTMLYDLSVSLTTMLDLDEILATVAGGALEIERADLSAVVLLDEQGRQTQFAGLASSGEDVDPQPFLDHPALHRVMTTGELLIFQEDAIAAEPELWSFDARTRSCVLVPILVKGQPVGVLIIAAYQPRHWSDRDQSLLTILTTQAASAIENAHLFTSEQEKRRLADTLREVALTLTSTLDPEEVLTNILVQLRRVVHYDSTSVQLLHENNELELISQRGPTPELEKLGPGRRFPAIDLNYPNHRVITTQKPYIVNDTYIECPAFQDELNTQHIRCWMGVPLIYGNELLGMITLDSSTANFYTAEMADLALMFATQAAQAIAHARLFDQIRRFNAELEQMVAERTAALTAEKDRLEAVHTITTTLTASLDIDEIVLKTLELAANAVGVQRGSVLIRDPMRDLLIYRAVLTETDGLITTAEPFTLPPGNLVQWTLEHQQGVFIDDVRADQRWLDIGQQTAEIRSFLAVPLLAADVPLGVLMLNSRQIGYFGEEHLRLLSTIASEVAIAVHNAELYNFINEQASRLAELLQLQREETGKNRAILESIAEGVLVLDENDVVVLYNRAANQVLQISDAAIIGRALDRIAEYGFDGDERQRALLLYAALSEGVRNARQLNDAQHTVIELPGQTIDATFTPVTAPDGERVGVATVLRDITREIEADKAKREFISTVSHELRTPLTSVKGYVDLLMLGTAGPINDMQKSFLEVVKTNGDRLNALVEDLLEISRLENGKVTLKVKDLHLPELIDDIVESLRTETLRKRMQVELDYDPLLPPVEADAKRIGQVLTNLLSNAHKYTRDGGQIIVRAYRVGHMVQVDVADTGVGIPADELPQMFSQFFRANNALKDQVGGTGLGLSIAKSFVELHGGDMWVTSEVEVGSIFSFTLPIEHRRPARDEASALPQIIHAP
jgi:PAS domain S-box-containing protein